MKKIILIVQVLLVIGLLTGAVINRTNSITPLLFQHDGSFATAQNIWTPWLNLSGETQAPHVALPDLMIKSVSYRPASPLVGDSYVYFDVVIKNQGAIRAYLKNMKLSLYKNTLSNLVGEMTWGVTSPEFLEPGQEKTIRDFTTTDHSDLTKTAGTFTVIAFIDSKNVIPESNEGNNQLSKSITIAAKQPDLVITDISWTPNPTSYASFTVIVKNQGRGDAGAFVVSLTTGGQTRTANAGKLTAGQTLSLSLTPAVRYTSTGNYPLQATADSKKQVAESNEGNNTISETLTIPVAPPQVVYLGMNRTLTPPFHFGETGGSGILTFGAGNADPATGKAASHVEVVGSALPRSSDYWAKVGETFRVEQGSYPNTSCNATIILNYHWNGYLSVVSTGGRSEAWIYGFATGLSSESSLQHWLKEWDGIESPVGSDRVSVYHGPLAKGGSYTAYIRMRSYGLVTLGTVITDFYARNRGAFLDSIEIVFE